MKQLCPTKQKPKRNSKKLKELKRIKKKDLKY
jgi:hypothetical protein